MAEVRDFRVVLFQRQLNLGLGIISHKMQESCIDNLPKKLSDHPRLIYPCQTFQQLCLFLSISFIHVPLQHRVPCCLISF